MIMTELNISTSIELVNDNNDLQIYQWAHFTIDIIGYKWNLYLTAFHPFPMSPLGLSLLLISLLFLCSGNI